MSKARLLLIRCSGEIEPQARDRKRDDGFQLTAIDGGGRAVVAERADPWDAVFEVFDKALLVGWAGPEQIN